MSDCTCTPGSRDNGWHETRCEKYVRAEIAEWGHVMAWSRNDDIVKRLQEQTESDS